MFAPGISLLEKLLASVALGTKRTSPQSIHKFPNTKNSAVAQASKILNVECPSKLKDINIPNMQMLTP